MFLLHVVIRLVNYLFILSSLFIFPMIYLKRIHFYNAPPQKIFEINLYRCCSSKSEKHIIDLFFHPIYIINQCTFFVCIKSFVPKDYALIEFIMNMILWEFSFISLPIFFIYIRSIRMMVMHSAVNKFFFHCLLIQDHSK